MDRVIYVIDGVRYHYLGPGLGAQLESLELRRKPAGTRRAILGVEFVIFSTVRIGGLSLRVRHAWGLPWHGTLDEMHARIHAFEGQLNRFALGYWLRGEGNRCATISRRWSRTSSYYYTLLRAWLFTSGRMAHYAA